MFLLASLGNPTFYCDNIHCVTSTVGKRIHRNSNSIIVSLIWHTKSSHRVPLPSFPIPTRILHGLVLLSAIIYSIDSVLCVLQTWSRIAFAFFGLKALSLLDVKKRVRKKIKRNQIEWEASILVNLTLLDSEQIFLGHLHQGKGFFFGS